jgi:hypothetical protein
VSFTNYTGKTMSRDEAIRDIASSSMAYGVQDLSPYDVREADAALIVKHLCNTIERTGGMETAFRLSIESVWMREDGKLKLTSCKILKLK